ncbi:hypothetical protein ACFV97_02860 [Streptomyces sp. NPDC059913]|uniref:hypothetical protein n=1 Tax=unclassified Streptomyces TaxID=2593676 RepID=UPI003659B5BA
MTMTTTRTPSTTIPGVVDGTVTPSVDGEGNLSLHIEVRNGPGRADGGDYIEIVLTGKDARALLSTPARTTFPCSVGVRLQTDAPLVATRQETSCP